MGRIWHPHLDIWRELGVVNKVHGGVHESVYGKRAWEVWISSRVPGKNMGVSPGAAWRKNVGPLWMQKEVASCLFIKNVGSLWAFCGVCDWEGRFPVGSLTM